MISIDINEIIADKIYQTNRKLSHLVLQTIILEDSIELNNNVYSLMGLLGGYNSKTPLKTIYYNNLDLPDF